MINVTGHLDRYQHAHVRVHTNVRSIKHHYGFFLSHEWDGAGKCMYVW